MDENNALSESLSPDDIAKPTPLQVPTNERDIIRAFGGSKSDKYGRFVLAALSSIPWVGILSAVASLKGESEQDKVNNLVGLWLQEHREKMVELGATIDEILTRLDTFGEEIKKRIESPEYLAIVRKAFKVWDDADTKDKRDKIKKLLMNAGGTALCPDDLIRLFIDWIDRYHDAHFMVIAQIYQNKGITRAGIWENIHGAEFPREDSAEASLFKYLIGELSLGRIIHIEREVNSEGQYMRHSTRGRSRSSTSSTMESAFEDTKGYELSELGSQFVQYVMNELVPRIA